MNLFFLCLRIEFVHCVYWGALFFAVLAPCSASRVWREPEDDTAPKKARGRTRKRCVARLREGRPSFCCKDNRFVFLLQSNGVFLFSVSVLGEIPQACGEVDDKRHIVPPRGERRPSRLHQNAQAMPSVSTFAPPPC